MNPVDDGTSQRVSLADALARGEVLLLDGGTGTELERRLGPLASPAWSASALLNRLDVVAAIHRDFVAAGADIVVANTFRVNPLALEIAELGSYGPSTARFAITAARASGARFVAASVGPAADCYQPEAAPDDARLRDDHARRVAWMKEADATLLWIETMNSIREAEIAARAARSAGLAFTLSFVTCQTGNLLSGESIADAVKAVEPLRPIALGLNCIPPSAITAQLPILRAATNRPLMAYGHVGNRYPTPGWSISEAPSCEEYAYHVEEWIACGARIVGGCCGTTPDHIRAVAARLVSKR